MRIGIDIRPLQTGVPYTGTAIYIRNLLEKLLTLDVDNQYVLLMLSNYPAPQIKWPDRASPPQYVRIFRPRKPERWHALYDVFFLRGVVNGAGLDLFHATYPIAATGSVCRNVVTIYDLIYNYFPEVYLSAPDVRFLHRRKLSVACDADRILVPSDSTRDDVVAHLGVPREKVVVTLGGLDSQFQALLASTPVTSVTRLGINEPYILGLGGFDFRKNALMLIKAYARLGVLHDEIRLVIAGCWHGAPVQEREVRTFVREHHLNSRVTFLGMVSIPELVALYRGAALFAYPSLYEGFGLPILEAMACETPVVTSNVSSIPEIAGEAALLVNPYNEEDLAAAMYQLLTDADLRSRLIRLGWERVQSFSWEEVARRTLTAYKETLRQVS